MEVSLRSEQLRKAKKTIAILEAINNARKTCKNWQIKEMEEESLIYLLQPSLTLVKIDCWPFFWNTFETYTGKNNYLDNTQKLSQLMNNLLGEVEELLEGYMITSNNYELVKKFLKEWFDEPSGGVRLLLAELDKLPVGEPRGVTKLIQKIERILQELEVFNTDVNQEMIKIIVESKLSIEILIFIKKQRYEDPEWNMIELKEAFRKYLKKLHKVKS